MEARSEPDGIVEAIRWKGESYVFGVQWHPELHDYRDESLLDGTPILNEFLWAARVRAGLATSADPIPREHGAPMSVQPSEV